MKFEYNGNLLEEDRVNEVANEIVMKYPTVDLEKAKAAARLEGKISADKTYNDELNRLYNIMLVNSDNRNIVHNVFRDYLLTLKNSQFNVKEHFVYLMEEINIYLKNGGEFPFVTYYE